MLLSAEDRGADGGVKGGSGGSCPCPCPAGRVQACQLRRQLALLPGLCPACIAAAACRRGGVHLPQRVCPGLPLGRASCGASSWGVGGRPPRWGLLWAQQSCWQPGSWGGSACCRRHGMLRAARTWRTLLRPLVPGFVRAAATEAPLASAQPAASLPAPPFIQCLMSPPPAPRTASVMMMTDDDAWLPALLPPAGSALGADRAAHLPAGPAPGAGGLCLPGGRLPGVLPV